MGLKPLKGNLLGLEINRSNRKRLAKLITKLKCPIVLDAGGLSLLADQLDILSETESPIILTPHLGEMKRLYGAIRTDSPIPQEREALAEQWFQHLHTQNTYLVIKGPNSLVAGVGHKHSYNSSGNPGLATAGSGDVLAGVITGLMAQGYSAWDSSRLGVYWHGSTADLVAQDSSEASLIAGDLLSHLGRSWQQLLDRRPLEP